MTIISDDDNNKFKHAKNEDTSSKEISYDMSFETNEQHNSFTDDKRHTRR